MIEHNYPVYIAVWLVLSMLTLWFFRAMGRKMKNTEDRQTKSSLFTIMIVLGLPMLLAAVLLPLVFIIGDKNMGLYYKLTWSSLILIFIIYFFKKQRSSKEEVL